MDHKTWVRNVFDGASSGYGEKGCSFFDYFGEKLVTLATPSAGDKILDVATGKGAALFPAARRVGPQGKAVGIDLSAKMIEEAAKKAPFPWIELHQMDAESLSFPDSSFDVVFCAFALFFFPDVARALSEYKRVLRPQGRLAVSTFRGKAELDLWISERVKEFGINSRLGVAALDSADALRKQLADAGFTDIEIHEESKIFWHETAEQWWNSLWTHGIRARLEQLSLKDLECLKEEALVYAGSGRVAEERRALYAIARAIS